MKIYLDNSLSDSIINFGIMQDRELRLWMNKLRKNPVLADKINGIYYKYIKRKELTSRKDVKEYIQGMSKYQKEELYKELSKYIPRSVVKKITDTGRGVSNFLLSSIGGIVSGIRNGYEKGSKVGRSVGGIPGKLIGEAIGSTIGGIKGTVSGISTGIKTGYNNIVRGNFNEESFIMNNFSDRIHKIDNIVVNFGLFGPKINVNDLKATKDKLAHTNPEDLATYEAILYKYFGRTKFRTKSELKDEIDDLPRKDRAKLAKELAPLLPKKHTGAKVGLALTSAALIALTWYLSGAIPAMTGAAFRVGSSLSNKFRQVASNNDNDMY